MKRLIAATLAVVGLASISLVGPAGSGRAEALAGFPDFRLESLLIDPVNDPLVHNPTGELTFPTIFHAGAHLANPLAEYYLYVAPHDAPGGISLFYSDDVTGPWIEYAGNPIISNTWSPNYSVSHVSSPYAIWNDAEQKMFLYFHGENTITRYATSTDGTTFSYGGTALTTAMLGSSITEVSYARVFKYTIPRYNNVYAMTFMANNTSNIRKMYLAYSNDGRSWTVQPTPLVSPNAAEGANISSGEYWYYNGGHYVVYGATSGNTHVAEVGANFDLENHLGVLYDPAASSPEVNKSGPMVFVQQDGELYGITDIGGRLDGRVALYRSYTGETYVPNQGFELDGKAAAAPLRWSEWNHTDASRLAVDGSGAAGSKYYLEHSRATAYRVSTFQTVTGLANGSYTVSARVRASAGAGTVQLQAKEYAVGASELVTDLPKTGAWTTVQVANVPVTNGQIKIALYSDRAGGTYADFDDITITKQ